MSTCSTASAEKRHEAIIFILSLLLLILFQNVSCDIASDNNGEESKRQESLKNASSEQTFSRLDCAPGEQRQFSYESSTRVWGSSGQQVRLRATLRLKCMESLAPNSTLKYLVEIVSLTPAYLSDSNQPTGPARSGESISYSANSERSKKLIAKFSSPSAARAALLLNQQQSLPRAEPLLEEVGEVATRMKRSVSGWFSKAWLSVKDFFGNIFSSSERTTITREQAFRESGLDISSQCKVSSTSPNTPPGKGSGLLPFDESVFEDLGPEYYVGASSLDGYEPPSSGTNFLLGAGSDDDQAGGHEDDLLSFFDDPKPPRVRTRRSTGSGTGSGAKKSANAQDYEKLIKIPFVFLQARSGKVLEVRFSGDESDLSVKNFKRHLCDLFATNLDKPDNSLLNDTTSTTMTQLETSPIGKHQTNYTLDASSNSIDSMKSALIKSTSGQRELDPQTSRQLVRALASLGTSGSLSRNGGIELDVEDEEDGGTGSDDRKRKISVLRSINTTSAIQLNSKMLASQLASAEIERMEVSVKQVQQITSGRMVGTAGQMSMSLVQPATGSGGARQKRSATSGSGDQLEDISELLRVSTSFSMQIVPMDRTLVDDSSPPPDKPKVERVRRSPDGATSIGGKTKKRRSLVVRPPADAHELQRMLYEWDHQETRLQMSAQSLMTESSAGELGGQLQRLEVLRDQIKQRLNEEFVRNRIRRSVGSSKKTDSSGGGGGDLGLGLTQLVLGNGVTTRRKGSIYASLEETLELEAQLEGSTGAGADDSISRLIRDTIRIDRLRDQCRSAVPKLQELRNAYGRTTSGQLSDTKEQTLPFGFRVDEPPPPRAELKFQLAASEFERAAERKLDRCRAVLRLMLKLNDRQAISLTLELIDSTNQRLLEVAHSEELGYGPVGKHYRRLRQQLVELLAHVSRPSESLVDKLLARLYYTKLDSSSSQASTTTARPQRRRTTEPPEFVYVSRTDSTKAAAAAAAGKPVAKYNGSLLKEADDFNNNDGAAQLVMTLTTLAAKNSVGSAKRSEVVDKLLKSLKGTSCQLFDGPDLDIIESMANFQAPMDEIVGRVVGLARRCKLYDQYVVACVHALSGQLNHSTTGRFLNEQLRSSSVSCTIKSEIVLTLINAQFVQQFGGNQSNISTTKMQLVDETLRELLDSSDKRSEPDRRCLRNLIVHYFKRQLPASSSLPAAKRSARRNIKREVVNADNFWDESSCKRWTIGNAGDLSGDPLSSRTNTYLNETNRTLTDLVDELDDNSLVSAIMNESSSRRESRKSAAANRTQRLLVERELEANSTAASTNGTTNFVRKRHKCTASKEFGPRNARAHLKAELVNDLVGARDENKFLARFRLSTNFLGNQIDVGRMYLWHQRRTTRAYANILGRAIWDTSSISHANCASTGTGVAASPATGKPEAAPTQMLYMPLFDFNLWLLKVSVGLRLSAEMGFYSGANCQQQQPILSGKLMTQERPLDDELQLNPTIGLRASAEATAKLVVVRAGMSVASQYGYQGAISVSRQPESCMSVYSSHQPMNVTFASWFQLWDNDCHFWGSRTRAEPQALKWRLGARHPIAWLENECLAGGVSNSSLDSTGPPAVSSERRAVASIRP